MWLLASTAVAAQPASQPATAPSAPSVTFLNADAAAKAILDDSAEPMFDTIQPAAMSAFIGEPIPGSTLEEQRAECRRRFKAGAREFSAREQTGIRRTIEAFHPKLLAAYPMFARTPWSFIKVSNNLCGGLPHTRGPHIVLSEGICHMMAGAASRGPARAQPFAAELFVHEQMHVFQKAHPGFFDPLYTRVLGFEFCPKLKSHPYLIENALPNPDGTDCRWILPIRRDDGMRYVLPLLLLSEGEGFRPMPANMREVAVYLKKTADGYEPLLNESGQPVIRDLQRVPEFAERFGGSSSAYHPNEAGADLFATLFTADFNARKDEPDELGEGREDSAQWKGPEQADNRQIRAEARRWFKQHLRGESLTKSAG